MSTLTIVLYNPYSFKKLIKTSPYYGLIWKNMVIQFLQNGEANVQRWYA